MIHDINSKICQAHIKVFLLSVIIMHDPISHNCAVSMLYTCIILPHNLNSTKLHLQGVAPRSQYSDLMLEAVTLQQFAPIIAHKGISQ